MSNSATHSIRFSGAVYGASKGSYSERCVNISIHMTSTVVALKVLTGLFTNMFTHIAGLTGVSRVNHYNRDAIKQSLVLQKQAKLSKRPSPEFGSKGFVSFFRSKPNFSQVTGSNTFTTLFSDKDNSFCNSSAKWFECTFCFLVKGIRSSNLGKRSYQYLRRKLKCVYGRIIELGVQFNCIENLFLPCNIRNGTAGSIRYPHGFREHGSLLTGRQKLDFQGQFHHTKFIKVAI